MSEFEKQVIVMLGKILEKQTEHDEKFKAIDNKINSLDSKINSLDSKVNALDSKLNTVMEQTAKNTEFNTVVKEQLKI